MNRKNIIKNLLWQFLAGATSFGGGCFLLSMTLIIPSYRNYQAKNWKKVPCKIISCDFDSDFDIENYIELEYQYEIDNNIITSANYSYNPFSINYKKIPELKNLYIPGTSSFCYVNPREPGKSVVSLKSYPKHLLVLIVVLPLIVIGCGMMILTIIQFNSFKRTNL